MTWQNNFFEKLAILFVLTFWGPLAAAADTSAKDIQIAARAVAFMTNAPTGDVVTAIIYDPANNASKTEADAIMAAMAKGVKAGKAKLFPKLVSVVSLENLNGSKVAFITSGMGKHHAAIFTAASAQAILIISTDMSCVNTGNCVVGVASKPKVAIIISRSARDAAGIGFKSAFLMMVKEK